MTKFELHLPIASDQQPIIELLAKAAARYTPLSNGQIKSAINNGALWLERNKRVKRLRKIKKTIISGDTLHFYYDSHVLSLPCLPAKLIEDFGDYTVLYKPSGMPCHGSKWGDHCTITRWAETQLQPQRAAFLVHRLDKAASGLILLAHSKKAARALSKIFENRTITKRYQIIVHGIFNNNNAHIETPIDGKPASTTFACFDTSSASNLSLLDVNIDTGRKHQIRKHAASIGFPIVGDRLHGQANEHTSIDLQLTAVYLNFLCPLTEQTREISLATTLRPNLNAIAKNIIDIQH
ncbi:RluA family pseudouridine synthase [Thalassotalea sediminis]|uniref:RluA family pseudouridine synthase n=1 Tax=Thalassotalea sediminis TaxID=1759089 RepID=UPI002572E79A|nr:RluA family pseudouridine synthase [Thalassotalea sediminis]